ncbi:MAG: thiamine-phosphate kinase [Thalassolituus sp.]|uniref:thiamine-phosphate kinase n=1 Tax=Thalassolituus sp. TaxID=2030822 RepID=UPI003982864E
MSEHRGEFDLIRRYFADGYPQCENIRLGNGDDASVIALPADMDLAQSIDTQVADVHFPAKAPAHLIAGRALRCAVSDLAAMGAWPQGFHLALTLPNADEEWLADFANGLRQTAHELGIGLLGGDTTSGPTTVITIAVQGLLPQNERLIRSGAEAGDDIWLTGNLGAATLALDTVINEPARQTEFTQAYYHPQVHIAFGQLLLTVASACLDISDGLLQDATHIAKQSNVTMHIEAAWIPTAVPMSNSNWSRCLTGGDDYQLLFTAPPEYRSRIEAFATTVGLDQCLRIGSVKGGAAKVELCHNGEPLELATSGYQHF